MVAPIPGIEVREADKMIVFPNGGIVQVKSADRPDSLRGESLDFVVFDEVADIKADSWFEAIRPALADKRGGALFIGTPRGMDNWFYDLWLRASNDKSGTWEAFQQPTITNTAIPGLVEEVEEARADMHPVIANQEFDAQFVVTGGTVFHDNWQRWYQLVGNQRIYDASSSVVLIHEEHIYETANLAACLRFGTSDLAVSLKTSADYTVIAAWALTPMKNLILLDFERRRMEGPDIVPTMQKMRALWKLSYMGIEKVAFQLSLVQEARRKGMPVRELTPDKDKLARAYNAAAQMQGGKVWWRKTIPEMASFSSEVMNFPLAAHDDCVDTLSYATTHIDRASTGPQFVSW
jgi:predicted phage terminase large subunit-like protein